MKHSPHQSLRTPMFFVVVFTFLASLWSSQVALAQELQWTGRIDAMPASGLQGDWLVAGRAFAATGSTEFRTDKGPFAVGVCVEVEYVGAAQPFTATKIASKNSDDCASGTATPTKGMTMRSLVFNVSIAGALLWFLLVAVAR